MLTDEEKRWLVVGICLSKVLTPALRKVIEQELQKLYWNLIQPPTNIRSQTSASHLECLPPSALRLNYININDNIKQASHHSYDYSVKDEVSLAKLFVKPYMSGFTAFDESLDTSAALSILCGAPNFVYHGIDIIAMDVRNDVRNEWGHCKFATWTEAYYLKCFQLLEKLIKSLNLPLGFETEVLKDFKEWRNQVKSVEESKEILLQDRANVRELFGLEIQRLEKNLEEGLDSLKGQLRATKSENHTTMAAALSKSCKQDNDDFCQQEVVERVTGLWKGVVELMPLVFSHGSKVGLDSSLSALGFLIVLILSPMLIYCQQLCLEGSIPGHALVFGLKSDNRQIHLIEGVEFTWEKLRSKNEQDLNFRPINIRGMRYFYNIKRCLCNQLLDERRPSELQIHGAQFLAVNSKCTEVYYYDTDGIWDIYYNTTSLQLLPEKRSLKKTVRLKA
ncbi:hypothetical protein ACROYT_G001947 [Oculina patagonica]